ncbi:MAG TPA: type 4a pilus biogenesis protein PilO [Gammaproteobacteria bacterium]|nr:type 4a pilus biogenesis protein PilO [Gammaproteobacteria bacterium]
MNVLEELRSLDTNDPGRWPLPFRVAAVVLVLVLVAAAGIWYFVVKVELPALEQVERQEQELRTSFETKQRRAANFDAYRNQLAEIERDFGTMLRQLPGETEVPSLLEDISQTALAVGLEEKQFLPQPEIPQDFYAELPIRLRYTGDYHEIGEFVSGVAALPRIVTMHDITITPVTPDGEDLQVDVTGKTYRYLDEESP